MEKFDTELLDTFEKLADHFAIATVQKWAANIKRRKIINTRQLLSSLNQDTKKDLGRMVIAMRFSFEEHGRMMDIKNKHWSSQPPIEDIIAWIEKKGLSSFGPDPKPNKKKPKSDERRRNEIAWGIARQYTQRRSGQKARPWFQSSFYKGLNLLYEEIFTGVADRSIEAIKDSLAQRLKGSTTSKFI